MAAVSCSILLITFFTGSEIFAKEIYTNVWAVKVRGGRQEAEDIALKYGFSYKEHVSKVCMPSIKFKHDNLITFLVSLEHWGHIFYSVKDADANVYYMCLLDCCRKGVYLIHVPTIQHKFY